MRTEHLHQPLSPQAHAALFDALQRRAERERQAALQRLGGATTDRLRALVRSLAAQRAQRTPAVRLMEG